MSRLSVLLLCRHGPLSASTRYRCLQYLPYLAAHGFDVRVETLLNDAYLQRLYAQRRVLGLGIPRAYARRLRSLFEARHYDVIWIHMEAFPWVPGWIESFLMPSGVPYVVDYDDAVYHRY